MKKLTFIIAACMFSILTYAGNNVPIKRTLNPNIEPQIKLTVQSNKSSKLNPKDEALKLLEQSKKAKADGNVPNFIGAEQLMKINAEKKERLDSIVGKIDEDENKVSLQSFTYDTYSHPVSSLNYTWNGMKNIWEFYSQNTYLWDEKGNCFEYLEQFYDSTGTKYIRSYNDDGTIKNIYSYTADQTGTWTGSQAVEYEYDNAKHIIKETHSWYDTSIPDWVLTYKVEATYDELGRQTSGAQLNWDGSKWVGNSDKQSYQYDENNNIIEVKGYKWKDDINDWQEYYRETSTYEGKKLKEELTEYWNSTTQTWNGLSDDNYNIKVEYFYDKQDRDTLDKITWLYEDGWRMKGYYNTVYTDNADGSYNTVLTKNYYHREGTEDVGVPVYRYYHRYMPKGQMKYELWQRYDSSVGWINCEEDSATYYNEDGHTDEVFQYKWSSPTSDRENVTYAKYLYNNSWKWVDALFKQPDSNDKTKWVNEMHFVWTFDNDTTQTSVVLYGWDNDNWYEDQELTYTFDYNMPLDNVLSWVDFSADNVFHKLLTKKSKSSGYDPVDYTYYYTPITADAIATLNNEGNKITVYPNPVADILYISSNDNVNVKLFNACGALVKRTTDKSINVQNLSRGIYIVDVNGVRTKIIKK
jgi:hypothetical protein